MSDSEINDDDEMLDQQEEENINEPLEEEEDDNGSNADAEQEEEEKIIRHEEVPQIMVERNEGDTTSTTYIFHDEDHTLGNALRFMLIKRPDVEFCGYSIPHPSENFMNMRLQTTGKHSDEVLKEGLKDLGNLCDIIQNKFEEAINKFNSQKKK